MSGLMASLLLAEDNLRVLLLEKEGRVGGKIQSLSIGGTTANVGAQYVFYEIHPVVDRYLDKLPLIPMTGTVGAVWNGGLYTAESLDALLLSLPLTPKARFDLLRVNLRMTGARAVIGSSREFFFDKEPFGLLWWKNEGMSASMYLSGYHEDVRRIYNMFMVTESGGGLDEIMALGLVGWYGSRLPSEPPRVGYLIQGGNHVLAEAIRDDFLAAGGALRLNSGVMRVRDTGTAVEIETENGLRYCASYAVVATPAGAARAIVEGLPPEKIAALDATRYNRILEVALHMKRIPTDTKMAFVAYEGQAVNCYIDQNGPDDPTAGGVICVTMADYPEHASDAEILDLVIASLQSVNPELDRSWVIDAFVRRWPEGIVKFTPGFLSRYQEALRRPLGRIHFAGDYTHESSLWGAAWSGVRAAEQILCLVPDRK